MKRVSFFCEISFYVCATDIRETLEVKPWILPTDSPPSALLLIWIPVSKLCVYLEQITVHYLYIFFKMHILKIKKTPSVFRLHINWCHFPADAAPDVTTRGNQIYSLSTKRSPFLYLQFNFSGLVYEKSEPRCKIKLFLKIETLKSSQSIVQLSEVRTLAEIFLCLPLPRLSLVILKSSWIKI